HAGVVDGDAGRVVVEDRADALAVADDRVDRVGQVEEKRLVQLVDAVPADRDADAPDGIARAEEDAADHGRVVGGVLGGGAVGGAVDDGDVAVADVGQGDGEDRV